MKEPIIAYEVSTEGKFNNKENQFVYVRKVWFLIQLT